MVPKSANFRPSKSEKLRVVIWYICMKMGQSWKYLMRLPHLYLKSWLEWHVIFCLILHYWYHSCKEYTDHKKVDLACFWTRCGLEFDTFWNILYQNWRQHQILKKINWGDLRMNTNWKRVYNITYIRNYISTYTYWLGLLLVLVLIMSKKTKICAC